MSRTKRSVKKEPWSKKVEKRRHTCPRTSVSYGTSAVHAEPPNRRDRALTGIIKPIEIVNLKCRRGGNSVR
jgi:hypothetical protein